VKGYGAIADGMARDWFDFAWVHLEGKLRSTMRGADTRAFNHPFTWIEVERYMVDDVTGPRQWQVLIEEQKLAKLKRLALIGRRHLLSSGKNVPLANIDDIKEVFGDEPTE